MSIATPLPVTTARLASMNPVSPNTITSAMNKEIKIITWRVAEAVLALPENADPLTLGRWNAGLAQEIVSQGLGSPDFD